MSVLTQTAFNDAETLEALRSHPDLMAIADAVVATQTKRRRPVIPLRRTMVVAAVVAVAAVAALVSPWPGRGSGFAARALAALGDGQVIHVISVSTVPGQTVIDVQTGVESPVVARTEIWFDGTRSLERMASSVGGQAPQVELQTPQGFWTQEGRVYTCAWIAAHPLEATKARVSCNASGDNGVLPRRVPEPRPALDPAIAGFVGGYRDALANGSAQRDGSGIVGGHAVEWLRFDDRGQAPAGVAPEARAERVAVDAQTLKPVLVETLLNGRQVSEAQISTIETLDPQGVDFSRPKQTPPGRMPQATSVTSQRAVAIADAADALQGSLLWAGQTLDGLPLTQTIVQQIASGFGPDIPHSHSIGVEVTYGGPTDWSSTADYVVLKESLEPQMLYGFVVGHRTPIDGSLLVWSSQVMTALHSGAQAVPTGKVIWSGLLARDGAYVTIEATSKTLLLDAARALELEVAK